MTKDNLPYVRRPGRGRLHAGAAMLLAGALGVLSTGCTVTERDGSVRDATFSESVNQFFDNLDVVASTMGAAADLVCAVDADCSSGSTSADSAPPPPPGHRPPAPGPAPRAQAGPGPRPQPAARGGPQGRPAAQGGGQPKGGKPQAKPAAQGGGQPKGGKPQAKPEERKGEMRP